MKNKLIDLNNHLFAQLERLGDEKLTDEQLKHEITRTKAISSIASNIVNNAQLALNVAQFKDRMQHQNDALPMMLNDKTGG